MSKPTKRKRRVTCMGTPSSRLDGRTLVLTECRNGIEIVVKIDLGSDETWCAWGIYEAVKGHVVRVARNRKSSAQWAAEILAEMGGAL